MAKYSPYFKFYVSEYNDGDIQLCSMEAQGLFTNLCSLYWSKEGELFLSKAKRLFKIKEKIWMELIDERIIKVNDDRITINFLDEQLNERMCISSKNSENGKLGGRGNKAVALHSLLDDKANESNKENSIEYKSKEEVNKREKTRIEIFSDEIFIEGLKIAHNGKDLAQAFNECYNHHSNAPNPPSELWQWKQKLNTWLIITPKSIKPNGKPKANTNSAEVIERRHPRSTSF